MWGGPVNVGYGTWTTLAQHLTRVGIWADHGYSAGALFRLLAHALGSNRLDQARVIILDVSDTRAHRPARHLLGREVWIIR